MKLWSVAPILDPTQEAVARVPRLLATLTGHFGAVNCASGRRAAVLAAPRRAPTTSARCIEMRGGRALRQQRAVRREPAAERREVAVRVDAARAHGRRRRRRVLDLCRLATVSLDNSVRVMGRRRRRARAPAARGAAGTTGWRCWDPIEGGGADALWVNDDRAVLVGRTGDGARLAGERRDRGAVRALDEQDALPAAVVVARRPVSSHQPARVQEADEHHQDPDALRGGARRVGCGNRRSRRPPVADCRRRLLAADRQRHAAAAEAPAAAAAAKGAAPKAHAAARWAGRTATSR